MILSHKIHLRCSRLSNIHRIAPAKQFKVYYVFKGSDGRFIVELRETVPVRMTESVVFACVFGAAFIGCGVAYLIFKWRIRRNNDA